MLESGRQAWAGAVTDGGRQRAGQQSEAGRAEELTSVHMFWSPREDYAGDTIAGIVPDKSVLRYEDSKTLFQQKMARRGSKRQAHIARRREGAGSQGGRRSAARRRRANK